MEAELLVAAFQPDSGGKFTNICTLIFITNENHHTNKKIIAKIKIKPDNLPAGRVSYARHFAHFISHHFALRAGTANKRFWGCWDPDHTAQSPPPACWGWVDSFTSPALSSA